MNLQILSASDWAWWGGALGLVALLIWANVRLKPGGPRLKISASPGKGWAEFQVTVTNIGNLPTVMESVRLRCRSRGFLGLWREVDLGDWFSLFGSEQSFPPLTLLPGESREIGIGPKGGRPTFPNRPLAVIIDVRAAHRFSPYRASPDATNFNKYARAMAIKTVR
jgi:hypothetical protein